MCLTGHPTIRTGAHIPYVAVATYVAVAAGAAKGAIIAFSGALPCKDGHWVISQIHGSVRAGDLRNLCSSYLLDFRSDMMRFQRPSGRETR